MNKINYILVLAVACTMCKTSTQVVPDELSPGKTINFGEVELLYTADELPINYDGSLSTIQKDENTMFFFHSWGCRGASSAHTWHYGPSDSPLSHLEMNKSEEEFWDYNGYYQNKEMEGIWILGMYKRDNGNILAITHSEIREFPGGKENQWFALGLGYSTDGGESFTFCGEIVTPANKYHNVGGSPYILIDDYIYVYFNDLTDDGKRQVCVARARLKEVLEAAEKHQVTEWYKYRDGKWDVPGLNSGISGSTVIPIVYGGEDVHSDATYCTALGKYLMTVQTHGANRLLLFSSEDGLNWEWEADVDYAPGYLQAYSSFVDYDGPAVDCREVDGEFYIYWPRRLLEEVHNNTMFRRKITIN